MARPWIVGALLALPCACVTPSAVKTASQQHDQNLATLEKSIEAYRKVIDDYYSALRERQRDAFIAQMLGRKLDDIVAGQLASMQAPRKKPDQASLDFIGGAVRLADARSHYGKQFDLLMDSEKGSKVRQAMTDKDLVYPDVAQSLDKQRANLDGQLEILRLQVQLMHRIHGVINQYLQVDATIDGEKIAQAAKAGADLDLSKFPQLSGLAEALKSGKGGTQ